MKRWVHDTRYIVAVSGGVDSVALLHMLHSARDSGLIVAHFDHGIRADSAQDADFVKRLAKAYKVPFVTRREELGSNASEELARRRRYAFLRELADLHDAQIITAHHNDDLIETIAINHVRGTGWRGLAVLDSDIVRPLLDTPKQEIIQYALDNNLAWREDSTNQSDAYLRNRLRRKLVDVVPADKAKLTQLHAEQKILKHQIDVEVKKLAGTGPDYDRHLFIAIDPQPAVEILRHVTRGLLTRPQLERVLLAIKTARPGGRYQAGNAVEFTFTPRQFTIKLIK